MNRVLGSIAVLVVLCVAQAGCSSGSGPTAPMAPPAPTHFTVFASDRNRTAGLYRNYFTDLDAGGTAPFPSGTAAGIVEQHPSITANGALYVYQSSMGRGGSQDVLGLNTASGAVTDDDNVNTLANETDPYISLDGHRLAFVRDTLGNRQIRLYDTQARRLIPLANLPAAASSDRQPALDETGGRIAFVSNRNGNDDVFVYDVATQTLHTLPLLVSPDADVEPSVSGNGRFVGFASNRTGGVGGYDLYVLDVTLNQLVAIAANDPGDDRDPSVSYDGTRIQFVSARSGSAGGRDLWLYNWSAGSVGRVASQNSANEDVDPVLVWK